MNNSIKVKNSKEATIQLKRAEVQKNNLIKNIYKEYETYFQIVRSLIYSTAEKGIFGLYSRFSIFKNSLNSEELNNFLSQNISLIINSKLPLITIEQFRLGVTATSSPQFVNVNALNELAEFNDNQTVNFDYENELISKEPFQFKCNITSNKYEYYESICKDEFLSLNLDKTSNLNSNSIQNSTKKIEFESYFIDSVLELIKETNYHKLNDYRNTSDQVNEVFISNDVLNLFEIVDKSFSHFLLNLSYEINSELFKINLIKKNLPEDAFKYLSNNNYLIKHPYPFVINYDFNTNKFSADNCKSSNFYLFSLTIAELEFYNLDLSICRNNINNLKKRFGLLNKKQRYWKNKEFTLSDLK